MQIETGMNQGEFASLWVLNPDITEEQFFSSQFIDFSMAAYCNQMMITEDNKIFDFDMYEKAPTGLYTAVLGGKGTVIGDENATSKSTTFEYISPKDLEENYLAKLNSLSAAQIGALLDSDAFADTAYMQLGIDKDILVSLDTDLKRAEYFNILIAEKPFTVETLSEAAKKADIIYKVNNGSDKYGVISEVFDAYNTADEYKEMYESIAENKDDFNSFIIKKMPFTDIENAYNSILESIAVCKLNVTRWENMGETLAKYPTIFKLTYTGDLKQLPVNTAKALAAYNFTSLNQLQRVVNNAGVVQIIPSSPSGGGGGGAGGGGGSSVSKPALDNTITEIPSASGPFSDLGGVEWAKESILRLYEKKIVNGDGNGNFNPNDNVTREQFAAMLIRAFNIDTVGADCGFADVAKDDWAYTYIATAFKSGIVSGMNETEFGYGSPIIRQDLSVMAERAVKLMGIELEGSECTFNDNSEISDYAKSAVEKLSGVKIINGTDGNRFAPKELATRAQAAKIICGILDLVNEREAQ